MRQIGLRRSWVRASLAAVVLAVLPWTATLLLADPVGECQAITTSQVETGQCLTDTLGASNHVLALALEDAQMHADSLDQVTGRIVARPALDQAQAEWEKFRDANCAVRSAFAGGASGSGQFVTSCAIEMTRLRTEELRGLAASG